MIPRPRVLVATPTVHGRVTPFPPIGYIRLTQVKTADVDIRTHHGYQTDESRESLAQAALDDGYSHVFFLDDDIEIPPGTLDRLLAWRYPVATGVYQRRQGTGLAQGVFMEPSPSLRWQSLPWPPPGEIAMITASGAGCLLIDVRVFRRMSKPWFFYDAIKGAEDMWFCRKLIDELEIPVLCDLQIRCKHQVEAQLLPGGEVSLVVAT